MALSYPTREALKHPTRALAEFVSGTCHDDLPQLVAHEAKRLLLDIMGLMDGVGSVGSIFTPRSDWAIPESELLKLPGYRHPKDADIAEAKKLMSEAGYAQGFKLNILARTMRVSQDAAIFVTGQVAKIGIDAKVQVMEDVGFWDRGRRGQREAMVYTPVMNVPDVETIWRYFARQGAMNYSGNDDDPKINELWDKERRAVDENQRKAIVEEAERHVLQEAQPLIPLVVPFTFLGLWPEVRNFAPGITDYGNNNLQEIWLAQ